LYCLLFYCSGTDGDKEKKKREGSKRKRDCFASEGSGTIDKTASKKGSSVSFLFRFLH